MESARASLDQLVANFQWISNVSHSYDFNTLLHSNDPPSPLQSVNLKISIDNMEYISGKIQAALDLLGNAVASLEAHMSRVQSLQRDYEVMLSPIRRVPAEILMEILSCTRTAVDDPENGRVDGFNVFIGGKGPWPLGQVCRRWRGVVSTLCPSLWATMTISNPASRRGRGWNPKFAVEMLEHALERTRGHLLGFLFEHHNGSTTEVYDIMDTCFNLMMGHSTRWRRAEFKIPPFFLPRLSPLRGKIDLLTDAYLQCLPEAGHHSDPITAFEIAPRLKFLRLKGFDPAVKVPFPTANLVSLSDERPFAGDQFNPVYTRIVKYSPKLLSLSYHDHANTHRRITLPPSHPRVTSLSIQTLSVSSANFLRTIYVPVLREVILTAAYEGYFVACLPSDIITALSELIHHSHCSLTRLSVVNVTIDGDKLPAVLRLTPCLEELFVQFRRWARDNRPGMKVLVESLAETIPGNDRAQHSIIPSLTSLRIVLEGIERTRISFVDAKFVAMIMSRHLSGALMKLVLHLQGDEWTYNMSPQDKTDLESLQLSGFVLDFTIDRWIPH
ncbi:hypothetical protein EV421DRAFT_543283 [Armillaria borealis]|uniref:F-box domain-containing protein n=1 Tax=Armillaria borealis TaxID=47425 RepID=A0AA39JIA8_9AGAR|nr:hypothetical protein EV421DRAFT_543283 [Armillaria borealis]